MSNASLLIIPVFLLLSVAILPIGGQSNPLRVALWSGKGTEIGTEIALDSVGNVGVAGVTSSFGEGGRVTGETRILQVHATISIS